MCDEALSRAQKCVHIELLMMTYTILLLNAMSIRMLSLAVIMQRLDCEHTPNWQCRNQLGKSRRLSSFVGLHFCYALDYKGISVATVYWVTVLTYSTYTLLKTTRMAPDTFTVPVIMHQLCQ